MGTCVTGSRDLVALAWGCSRVEAGRADMRWVGTAWPHEQSQGGGGAVEDVKVLSLRNQQWRCS